MDIHLKETIPKVFQPIHKAVQNRRHTGSRGQGRARVGQVQLPVAGAGFCSCCATRTAMRWCFARWQARCATACITRWSGLSMRWGVRPAFRCTVSPMECTYLPTGQKILFFGLDDAGKLKSLKLPFGSVGICWFEGWTSSTAPGGGAQRGAEHFPRRQLQFDFEKF